jgi:hypothetical protein
MTHPPNPGQIAYEAYWGARHYPTLRWQDVRRVEQQRWEAAAQAVRAMQEKEKTP